MSVVYAAMINKLDATNVVSGILIKVTLDGGTQVTGLGTLEYEGLSQWSYKPSLTELTGNSLGVLFHGNSSIPQTVTLVSDNPLLYTSDQYVDAPGAYADIEYSDIFIKDTLLEYPFWIDSNNTNKVICLNQATLLIDLLNVKGKKTDVLQTRKFPRDPDTLIPTPIKSATSLIANEILKGKDVERSYTSINQESSGIGPGKLSKNVDFPLVTDITGIPSFLAWKLLRRYILRNDTFEFIRVS